MTRYMLVINSHLATWRATYSDLSVKTAYQSIWAIMFEPVVSWEIIARHFLPDGISESFLRAVTSPPTVVSSRLKHLSSYTPSTVFQPNPSESTIRGGYAQQGLGKPPGNYISFNWSTTGPKCRPVTLAFSAKSAIQTMKISSCKTKGTGELNRTIVSSI